jgi:hypothetical protein
MVVMNAHCGRSENVVTINYQEAAPKVFQSLLALHTALGPLNDNVG